MLSKAAGLPSIFFNFRGAAWEFAFIPNTQWVLFYFRKPALKYGKLTTSEFLCRFPDAKKLKGGNFPLRIRNPDRAQAVVEYAAS
jgi:hypothetical protein